MSARSHNSSLVISTALSLLIFTQFSRAQSGASPEAATGGYRIAGVLVSKSDGHRLSRARVYLANVKDPRHPMSVITGENGEFAFSALAAGKYSLEADKRGFIRSGYQQHDYFWTAIVTGAGIDTEHLIFQLTAGGFISGQVLDENGEPVRRANVSLYRLSHEQGFNQVVRARDAITDDRGWYELGPQMPGTYYVSVRARPWYALHPPKMTGPDGKEQPTQVAPALDVAYPITYCGDATDPDAASPIQIRGGERVDADIHLAPVAALHVLLRTTAADGNAPAFPQLRQPGLGDEPSVTEASARMISPGLWELSGVPQGRYSAEVNRNGQMGQIADVDVSAGGQEIDLSGAESVATVKVTAQIPDEKTIPSQLALALRVPNGPVRYWKNPDSKGELQLDGVAPGRYEVISWNIGKPYGISHIAAEGADLNGRIINIGAGSTVTISMTLLPSSGEIEGVVKHAGKAVSGAMVVLVPNDPGNHPELFRRDQSDLDGTFTVHNVVSGTYTILAIEDGWDLDWSRPEVISAYLQRGQTVQVAAHSTAPVQLPQAVEAQAK